MTPGRERMIGQLTEQQIAEQRAAMAFCDCLRQDFGNVYVDAQGNHYVEIEGRWMSWKFGALTDERP